MKKNGFESPLEVQQVFTWIIFIAITAEFYALIFPIMEDVTAIVVGVVYGVLSFLSALFSFMACKIDPIDPRLEGQLNGIPIPREHGGRTAYCYICKCDVYQGSKHCHFCGKCVRRFDHHCRWLNNCIGCKNYKYFIALLLSTFSVLALQFGLSVWLIILYHTQNEADDDSLNNKVEESFDSLSSQGYIIIIYLFGIVIFPIVSLLMQLLGFHALLATRGLTTYQYIVQQQKRDHERRTIKASTAAQVTDEHIRSSPMCDSSSRANKDDITAPASNFATRPRSSMVNLSMQTESLASAHYLSHRKATSDLDAASASVNQMHIGPSMEECC